MDNLELVSTGPTTNTGKARLIKIRVNNCFDFCLFQSSEDDVSQFDTKFTKETPFDSPDEYTLSESANLVFQVSLVER